MDTNPRVLITESVVLLRAGLCALLGQVPGLEIVAALDDYIDAFSFVATLDPQLVLVGSSISAIALGLIRKIKRAHPHVRVLAICGCEPETSIPYNLRAIADGYVLKNASREEFCTAIRCALNGKICSTPNMSVNTPKRNRGFDSSVDTMAAPDTLTPRECEVLILTANGNSSSYIASRLGLSVYTVGKHRSRVMKKLNLHGAAALTLYAINKGLTSPSKCTQGVSKRSMGMLPAGELSHG